MTYLQISLIYIAIALLLDFVILKTYVLKLKLFWLSYSIVLFFQFLTNGVLTGFLIVTYNPEILVGSGEYLTNRPPLIGDGRLFFAPMEDVLFGFSMIVFTISLWVYFGRRGIQKEPVSGPPPKWWPKGGWYGAK
ncbi:MAG: hypothetical protein RL677_1037 [Actinomycetota bacterium]|jgi:hypothetical protein